MRPVSASRALGDYPRYWAHSFGSAPFLPTTRAEMDALGWEQCDVILVTGDAYVDHPSFGMAIIGRLLESHGFRVGIIAQPDWHSVEPFRVLGAPALFWGVTAGNMDSLVNHYTSDKKPRSDDAYTPGGAAGRRPDRAVLVYTGRCREAFKGVPVVIGGIEASLRRIAHYDYWSDRVRRSVLVDAKADLLVYGNAERAIVDIAHRLGQGQPLASIRDVRGTAFVTRETPEGFEVVDSTSTDRHHGPELVRFGRQPRADRSHQALRLPSFETVASDPVAYAHASRVLHLESNPHNARALVQAHEQRDVWINPPPIPLSTAEMDSIYELPYARQPHPSYGEQRIPAYEMIRFSVAIMRGCFGGCTFCSITEHEGRIIQNRSEASVLREIEAVRDKTPGFTGVISDLGGPTANMYRLACKSREIEASCRKPSCVYPDVCDNLGTNHDPLIRLYRKARRLEGIKKVFVASGLRYDLAVRSPEYVKELATHHVGGYLKIAPEHTEDGPLSKMMKPGIATYDRFKELFDRYSKEAGKKQYLIPYFIAAHPGTTDEDMVELALWLKKNSFRPDQVQAYLPSPMATATAMYHTGYDPLVALVSRRTVDTVKSPKQRRLHKALLRYHDPDNWPLLRRELARMGRDDLIGSHPGALVPAGGTRDAGAGRARTRAAGGRDGARRGGPGKPGVRRGAAGAPGSRALTQHTGLPPGPEASPGRRPKKKRR